MATFVTSDSHLCHALPDIWLPRGFKSADEHTNSVITIWNGMIGPDDDVFHLGDIYLSDLTRGLEAFRELHGRIHIIRGNHDTNRKISEVMVLPNVVECGKWADVIRYRKHDYYLSHHPTMCANMRETIPHMLNLHGHTHSPDRFQFFEFGCYNVSMDAHNCRPVLLDSIRPDYKEEYNRRLQLGLLGK